MIVLTGPSATGKTDTAVYLMEHYGLKKVITCTSRKPRVNEINDVDYHFITLKDFERCINNGEFLETATYNGNMYGTKKVDIGPKRIACLEPNGARTYKEHLKGKMFCVYLTASKETRLKRMIEIRKDGEAAANERILRDEQVYKNDGEEMRKIANFILNTDDLDVATQAKKVFEAYTEWLKTNQE